MKIISEKTKTNHLSNTFNMILVGNETKKDNENITSMNIELK